MADNLTVINCPACGKKMSKVFMPTQGINIDVCIDGCGGVYFDNHEFKKVDENHEDISPLIASLENKKFNSVNSDETRVCPVCNMKMVKHFASSKHDIQVDECYGCGGLFLDFDELQRIRDEYENEEQRAKAAIDELHYAIGDELKENFEKHVKIEDNSVTRKFISKLVIGYNLNRRR